MFHNHSSQAETQIASSWISTDVDIFWSDMHVAMEMVDKEFVNLEAIIRGVGKGMIWWHPIIYWKERHFELICPWSCVILGCMTWKANETATMHMDDNILKLMSMLLLLSFLNHWQLFVIEHSYQNMIFVFFENIQTFIKIAFRRNKNL